MMKTNMLMTALLLLVCATGMQAAKVKGNGKVVTRDIQVAEYDQVEVGISMSSDLFTVLSGKKESPAFHYKQTNGKASLKITLDENLFDELDITSSNGKLKIRAKEKTQISPTRLMLNGTSQKLSKVAVSGSIDFVLQSALNTDKLEVAASGASDMIMKQPVRAASCLGAFSGSSDWVADNLTCDYLEVAISGSSDAVLKGQAGKAQFSASGSSDVKAYDLVVKDLECGASGSSDMQVHATATIQASASGGSDIYYKGNPAKEHISASGGSSVKRSN